MYLTPGPALRLALHSPRSPTAITGVLSHYHLHLLDSTMGTLALVLCPQAVHRHAQSCPLLELLPGPLDGQPHFYLSQPRGAYSRFCLAQLMSCQWRPVDLELRLLSSPPSSVIPSTVHLITISGIPDAGKVDFYKATSWVSSGFKLDRELKGDCAGSSWAGLELV